VTTAGWVIVIILIIPMLAVLAWMVISSSLVRVPSGSLGLLLVRGRATDTALTPGPHFVPALRRKMLVVYPAVQLSFRAGDSTPEPDTELDRTGPGLSVTLGDRTNAMVGYTVRFRLLPARLREVHENFGPDGVFGFVRDETAATITRTLRDAEVEIDDLVGSALERCQEDLKVAVAAGLAGNGIELTGFRLGTPDLGRTGEVIQATLRARLELERERAEAATRLARAVNDAELDARLPAATVGAWRYRETDLWAELVQRTEALQVALRAVGPGETNGSQRVGQEPPPTVEER
jgi:regulator of protease activity HflC (stomatin/prohibitin superfamily)